MRTWLYTIGTVFLILTVYMTIATIRYEALYLANMEATFWEMKSFCISHAVEKISPYAGITAILFGIAWFNGRTELKLRRLERLVRELKVGQEDKNG